MAIDANSGAFITLKEAEDLTAAFRSKYPDFPNAYHVASDKLDQVLRQEGCVAIRIYNGCDGEGNMSPVIVGVDASGADMYNGLLLDRFGLCPPTCGPDSPLR